MRRIGFQEALPARRRELSEAALAATDEPLYFQLDESAWRFQMEVEYVAVGGDGIELLVATCIGFSGDATRQPVVS